MQFDVMEKIRWRDFLKALFSSDQRDSREVFSFNYLRNALGFIFKYGDFPKKRVIFPGFICPVVADSARQFGITPVFCDSDAETFNLDFKKISDDELKNVDAIFINHTFGHGVDIQAIKEQLKGTDIKMIEDLAHAGRLSESAGFSDFRLYSYYKVVANVRGGELVTENSDLLSAYSKLSEDKIDFNDLLNLFIKLAGPHQFFLNFIRRQKIPVDHRESDFQIRRLSNFLKKLYELEIEGFSEEKEGRAKIASLYEELTDSRYFSIQKSPKVLFYYNFSLALKPEFQRLRDRLYCELRNEGVFVDRMWYNAAGLEEANGHFPEKLLVTRNLASGIINLPIRSEYSREDVQKLFSRIYAVLKTLL